MLVRTVVTSGLLGLLVMNCGCRSGEGGGADRAVRSPKERAVMVRVNGVPIYREEFASTRDHAQKMFSRERGELSPGEREALSEKILSKMIEDELLVQHAREQGLRITAEQVQDKLEEMERSGGGDRVFGRFLEETGMDRARVRANLERNLLIELLAERIRSSESVSAEEMAAFYREHADEFRSPGTANLAHILLRDDPDGEDELARAPNVRKEIMAGMPFEKAAALYSDDAATREHGGSLGTVKTGDLLPALEKEVLTMEVGVLSQPVRSPLGVHLLMVNQRNPGRLRPLDEVRSEIKSRILQRRVEQKLKDLVERLGKKAVIQTSGI